MVFRSVPAQKKPSDAGWVLVGCLLAVFWFVLLFLFLCCLLFLPKVASHGVDVVGDSWLKCNCLWIFLTVLRHSRISQCYHGLDSRDSHLFPVLWPSKARYTSKAWYGFPKFHSMMEDMWFAPLSAKSSGKPKVVQKWGQASIHCLQPLMMKNGK